jgi:hypothetical protein
MKNFVSAIVVIAFATPSFAQNAEEVAAAPAAADENRCVVSSSGDGTTADVSARLKVWQLMQGQSGTQSLRFTMSPAEDGKPPEVSAHAVNTKGTGAPQGRTAKVSGGYDAARCAQGKHFPKVHIVMARTRQPIVTKDVADFTCDTSGDPADPIVTLHLPVSTSSKATFQDLHFSSTDGVTMVTGGGPGGGPRVQARCAAVPSSDAADLLLPAVQK